MSDKAYIQTRAGVVSQVTTEEAHKLLGQDDYVPADAGDFAAQEKESRNSTLGAKLKTFGESAAASAVDTAELPARVGATIGSAGLALASKLGLGNRPGLSQTEEGVDPTAVDIDPLRGVSGRAALEAAGGKEYAQNARERADANPYTSMAGNMAGAAVAGGGLAGLAKGAGGALAEGLGGGALARAGGAVATGAIEGGAYGANQASEESYLHNIPLSAEKLIASMGWGAVVGGTVSLAAHGVGAMLRDGSRGATPIDGPRASVSDIADSAATDAGSAAGEPLTVETPPKYEVNVGAFDKSTMRPESLDAVRANPEGANANGIPRIDVYEGEPPAVNDGRHRMQAAVERGETTIDAQVTHYDTDGNVVSESVQPIALADNGPSQVKGNWAHTSIRELPPESGTQPIGGQPEMPPSPGAAPEGQPSKISSSIREFADQRTAKALGANVTMLKKAGRTGPQAQETISKVAQAVRGTTLDDGTAVMRMGDSPEVLAERVQQAHEEASTKLADFREKADKVFAEHPEIAPNPEALADRIQKEIVEPLQSHPAAAERAKAGTIAQHVDDIRALSVGEPQNQVQSLTKIRQAIDDQVYAQKRSMQPSQQGANPELKELQKVRTMVEGSIEAASDKAAEYFPKAQAGEYKALKTQWRQLNIANDWAQAGQLNALGRRVVSPSDYGVGMAAGLAHGGPAGMVAGIAHHVVRERMSAVTAVLADKLAASLDGKIESGLGTFFRESNARAESGISSLTGVSLPVPIRRIATPAAVDAFMGRHKDMSVAYDKRVAQLNDQTANMGAGIRDSVSKAMGGASEAMPRLGAAATLTATKGALYLQSQIPGGTAAPTMFRPTQKTQPSDLEIREFAQKWHAVANPLSVVDDLRRGSVTHAQIDALKAVYPELYAEVRQKALEMVRVADQRGKRMPYNDRLQLDLFLDLGGAGEPTLSGDFIDRVVKAQEAAKQTEVAKPTGGSSGNQLSKMSTSRNSGAQTVLGS